MSDKRNIEIFLDKRIDGIVQSDGITFGNNAPSDMYITVSLFKTTKLIGEYIDIYEDTSRYTIERQEINPFYNELDFFTTINQIDFNVDNKNSSLKSKAEINNITINS